MCRHQKKRIKEWGGAKALILKRYLTHLPVQINRLQPQLVHTPPVFNVNGGMTTENKVTSSCAQHRLRNWPCSVIPILQHWNSVIFDHHHHHLRQPFHDQFPQFRFMCLKRTADSANHNTKTRATRATSSSTTTSGNESVELDNENPPPYTTTPTQPLRELLCAIATVVVVAGGGGSSAAYCSGLRRLSMASNRQLIHLQRERELSIIIKWRWIQFRRRSFPRSVFSCSVQMSPNSLALSLCCALGFTLYRQTYSHARYTKQCESSSHQPSQPASQKQTQTNSLACAVSEFSRRQVNDTLRRDLDDNILRTFPPRVLLLGALPLCLRYYTIVLTSGGTGALQECIADRLLISPPWV